MGTIILIAFIATLITAVLSGIVILMHYYENHGNLESAFHSVTVSWGTLVSLFVILFLCLLLYFGETGANLVVPTPTATPIIITPTVMP